MEPSVISLSGDKISFFPGPAFSERIDDLWRYMEEDGLVPMVFPGDYPNDINGWRSYIEDENYVLPCMICYDDDIVGAFWVYDLYLMHRVYMGMFLRRKYWRPGFTDFLGELALQFVFEKLELDLVMAEVLTANRLINRFLRRTGWRQAGEDIPSYFGEGNPANLWAYHRSFLKGERYGWREQAFEPANSTT